MGSEMCIRDSSFNPGAQDARALKDARVLVVNGLDFEGWLPRLQKASGFKGRLITASDGIQARQFEEADGDHDAHGEPHSHGGHDHDHGHSHDHGTRDPHAWQDVGHVLRYVDNISKGLVQADPSGASLYQAAAARYSAQLRQLDTDIRAAVARIPQARRRLVTTHDAFGYFSAAYGSTSSVHGGFPTKANPRPQASPGWSSRSGTTVSRPSSSKPSATRGSCSGCLQKPAWRWADSCIRTRSRPWASLPEPISA